MLHLYRRSKLWGDLHLQVAMKHKLPNSETVLETAATSTPLRKAESLEELMNDYLKMQFHGTFNQSSRIVFQPV